MTPRFEKAYNALYNAFMNDTLAKGTCIACAVGNIVADAMNAKIYSQKVGCTIVFRCKNDNQWWKEMFITDKNGQRITKISQNSEVKKLRKDILNLTGYTWRELARVESVFEKTTKIGINKYFDYTPEEIMQDQFNGLMAVMDVLIELDEVKEGEKYKNNFRNKFVGTI